MLSLRRQSGTGLIEYAILFGIVALALFSMNVYLKRGVQSKTKEMTDKFISDQQVGQVVPDTEVSSVSETGGPFDFNRYRMTTSASGASRMEASGNATYKLDSTEGEASHGQNVASIFVPWQSGTIQNVDRGGTYDYDGQLNDYDGQFEGDPQILAQERDRLFDGAAQLRQSADELRQRAADLGGVAEYLGLANDLRHQADEMDNRAAEMEQKGHEMQDIIDKLEA